MKRIAGVCVAALVSMVCASGALGSASAQLPLVPHYKCYDVQTAPLPVPAVSLQTQFGVSVVPVGPPTRVCLSAVKNGEGDLVSQDLECFAIVGQLPDRTVKLLTQFGLHANVTVGVPRELCIPASKAVFPGMPPGPPPFVPHYECFEIAAAAPQFPPVELITQFGVEHQVPVGPATRLCLPAIKNGEGSLGVPHLECFVIAGPPLGIPLNLMTQFGPQMEVVLGPPSELCVPARKAIVIPVGGEAEAPDVDASSTASGGSSGTTYAAIGGIVAGVMLLSAAGWYARRRWAS